MTLPIKPEELTRAEPSRVSAVNALGGAWVDSFGRGLTNLTISGNTGWRIKSGLDGIGQFSKLRDEIIHKWHTLREERIAGGKDPGDVRLFFIDELNGAYVAEVVPMNFTLRRSKSQPLLLMYNLTMTATNDKAVRPADPDDGSFDLLEIKRLKDKASSLSSVASSIDTLKNIQESLKSSLTTIGEFGRSVHGWTDRTFGPAMDLANEVITTANMTKEVINSAGQVAVNLATDLSAVGTKLWEAVGAVASLPNAVKSEVMQIKGAFSNLHCVLANGYGNSMLGIYEGSDLYGSSNCSSTAGGRGASKYKGINSFEMPGVIEKVRVSTDAVKAIQMVKASDRINPIDTAQLAAQINQMNAGVTCLS